MNLEKTVALRMIEEIRKAQFADRETLALKMRDDFGDAYIRQSEYGNGNVLFTAKVMKEFNNHKGSDMVWDARERGWRTKDANDL